jgi:ATP-dependent protease ClpP protease subunit
MTDTMDVADADFTPNPDRAIWIRGDLNGWLLNRLRPEILELTARSRAPITVFIDSRGGSPEVRDGILSLLRQTDQGDASASRIITVATSNAQSGAADLLSAGDFAIANPECALLYHGLRFSLAEPQLTYESAKLYAGILPALHERAAAALAQNSVRRFLSIVSAERALFGQHRADAGDPTLTDLRCFQAILRGKLSPAAQKVLDLAIPLWESYNGLLIHFQKRLRRGRTATKAHLQKLMLHASIAFEYESDKGNQSWDGGLSRIGDHFYFLNAYFDFGRLGDWVAGRTESQTADTDVEADYLLQFRGFFLAICRALQDGENYITPLDARWLGLIDRVRADLTAP